MSSPGLKIAVCGNIGVGKSTLCEKLSVFYKNCLHLEEEIENPYLPMFYSELAKNPAGPNKFSLPLQKYFLLKRFERETEFQL